MLDRFVMMPLTCRAARLVSSTARFTRRHQSTLSSNSNIYIFDSQTQPASKVLTLLKTNPPLESLALGTTTEVPPTPNTFRTNPRFMNILNSVVAEHAASDPQVQGQAAALASSAGAALFRPMQRTNTGSSPTSAQGGAGGAGRGGWVHVSDNRHPPDFGRIAEPEDIFGSVEVDAAGGFVDGHGRYSPSGTYRIVTKEGVLGLPSYLMTKLKERMQVEEASEKSKAR